ncbi:hypothetical protein I7I51_01461 [Histoplasma capsulatum]|uniref:Uncharacterized protein n=1 Tax=Ajellomyces capsulatus TaxID=5037 RepID=A0A8A1MIG4_AJECA|nr:hypothetical protein I7I51_01461 [Histoplasma capsulatum]
MHLIHRAVQPELYSERDEAGKRAQSIHSQQDFSKKDRKMHRRFWQKWIFPFSATNLRDQHPVSRALPRFPFLEKGLSGLVAKYRLDESRAPVLSNEHSHKFHECGREITGSSISFRKPREIDTPDQTTPVRKQESKSDCGGGLVRMCDGSTGKPRKGDETTCLPLGVQNSYLLPHHRPRVFPASRQLQR